MEWKLFADAAPNYTTAPFFQSAPWVPPESQRGHAERVQMVADLIHDIHRDEPISRLVDLGCGDGSLLAKLTDLNIDLHGIDLGKANVHHARLKRLSVSQGSFFEYRVKDNDFIVMTEVLEHLLDPHGFLRALQAGRAVFSSPWDENDISHYSEHAWAWDEDGYAELVAAQGFTLHRQVRCDAGFQAVYVKRQNVR